MASVRQQARDDRLERACRSYLLHGAATKASRDTGIPRQTVEYLVKSADGQALIARLRTEAGPDVAARCLTVAGKFFDVLEARISDPKQAALIPARDLAVVIGIVLDKARAFQAPASSGTDAWEVSVKFGGARISNPATGGPAMDVAAAQVSVRGPGKGPA